MNWNLPEYNPESVFQCSGGYANAFQGPVQFSSSNSYEIHHQNPDQHYFRDINLIKQKQKDQDFISTFIKNIQSNKKTNAKNQRIKISEGKSFLLKIIAEKKRVEVEICKLDVTDKDFDVKWDKLVNEIQDINKSILKFHMDIKIPLKVAILKRKKKREYIKKRKAKYKTLKEQLKIKIEEKHKVLDELLNKRSEEVERIKREAALKRQADSVLHEVRKKKYEGRKMLNLLSALAKLRELRIKQEEEKGGYCSKQLTETFNIVIDRFKKLWDKQLEVYKLEEKGLKIMLEENALPYVEESKFELNLLQWEKVLFGDVLNDEKEKQLMIADSDIQALIQVRSEWDQFLQKDSTLLTSGIPSGWVLPPETENEEWKAFTKISKKIQL